MPILCAFVPSYKVEVARLLHPELRDVAVLVVDRLERGRVVDLDDQAAALGARTGMTLLQAAACAREARTVVGDPTRNRALWETALDALDAVSPLVEDAAEGIALLEMRGISGTPEQWFSTASDALSAAIAEGGRHLPFVFGLAANPFVARAAAQVAAERKRAAQIVPRGAERAFLKALPLGLACVDVATNERLRLLGVRTLGDLAALPHGPFVRRFGAAAAHWHARARGIDDTPLVPRPRVLRIDRSLYGEGTADREDQLLFALRTLVSRVAGDIAVAGKRCGFLRFAIECEDAQIHELPTVLAQPTSTASTMFDLLRARLEGVTFSAPVVGLRLGAERLEEGGTELSLFAGDDPDPEVVGIALARLEAALGDGHTLRAVVSDGNRPETRFRYEPFLASDCLRSAQQRPELLPERPALTLCLVEPRDLEVTTHAGFPRTVGTPPQPVLDVAGPWRVDEAWWDDALAEPVSRTVQRDEFDVLLEDGTLWRIARDGARWTLRGTYD